MKKTYLMLTVLLVAATISYADTAVNEQSAVEFTQTVLKPAIEKILTISKSPEIDPTAKAAQYDEIISPLFDYSLASKLTLGKEKWESLTAAQQQTFVTSYGSRLQRFYINRILLLYPDTAIAFIETVQQNDKAEVTTQSKSKLIQKDYKRDILYHLRYSSEHWAIYDVTIEGVSILNNYREQFNHLMNKGTFEDLINRLENTE